MPEKYEVVKKIHSTSKLDFYLARDLESKVSKLDLIIDGEDATKSAYVLQQMSELSTELEEKHPKVHPVVTGDRTTGLKKIETDVENPKLHYDWLFPRVKDIVVDDSEEYRRLLVLEAVDSSYGDYIFLDSVLKSDLKIDLKTSAWIYGRFLKLDQFMNLAGKIYIFDRSNILIEPVKHRLIFLDYSSVEESKFYDYYEKEMEYEEEYEDRYNNFYEKWETLYAEWNTERADQLNSNALETAKFMLELIGVNPERLDLNKVTDKVTKKYLTFFKERLEKCVVEVNNVLHPYDRCNYDPESLHREFYKLIDGLWGHQYHEFTTIKK